MALARALVNRPKVLLLDEPLGALDLKLREQMQEELKALQKTLGITFIFVTHDQGEALSMADRVAVFNDGKVMQVGTPEEIYKRPELALRRRFRRLVQRAAARLRQRVMAASSAGRACGPRPSASSSRATGSVAAAPSIVAQLSRRHTRLGDRRRRAAARTPCVPAGEPCPAEGERVTHRLCHATTCI